MTTASGKTRGDRHGNGPGGGLRRQKLPFLPRKPQNTTESQTDKHHFHRTGINAERQQKADNGGGSGGISQPFRQHKPADDKRHRRKIAENVYREIQPAEYKRSQRRKQCRRQPGRRNGKAPVCGKQRRTGRKQGKRQPGVKQRKYLAAKQCRIKNKLAVAPLKQPGTQRKTCVVPLTQSQSWLPIKNVA